MDIVEFREYCLGLGDVAEKTPFGKFAARYDSILVFYVCGHMFCFVDMDDFTYVNLKADPEVIAALRASKSAVSDPTNQSLRHWIKIGFHGDVPQQQILSLVRDAYELVKTKYTRRR